jgi:hypothetical protein
MTTPNLSLPELIASQAQPHVTVNTALRRLDALVQAAVISQTNTPPGSPADGDAYLVGAAPTGAWVGHAQELAVLIGGGWTFLTPAAGWLVYNQGDGEHYRCESDSPLSWAIFQSGSGGGALADLTDVNVPASPEPDDGDVLTWDAANNEWVAAPASGGSSYLSERRVFYVTSQRGSPVGSPATGRMDLINLGGASPSGAWSGWTRGNLAYYNGTSWEQVSVAVGDIIWLNSVSAFWTVTALGPIVYAPLDPGLRIPLYKAAAPTSSEVLLAYVVPGDFRIPDDFVASVGAVGVNPSSSFVMDVKVDGSSIGSITVATDGTFTFSTTGTTEDLAQGSLVEIVAPSSTDANIRRIAITLIFPAIVPVIPF